jgi:hypothetical protein
MLGHRVVASLFDPGERAEIVRRIESLHAGSSAQWGKMTVAQMLAHCQAPLRVATGGLALKRGLFGILFGRLAKKSLSRPEPFKRGLPTAPEFVVRDTREFTRERDGLLVVVHAYGRSGPGGLTKNPHPFFGPMTAEEWDTLQWKHLDHHLRQFGA